MRKQERKREEEKEIESKKSTNKLKERSEKNIIVKKRHKI